MEPVEPQSSGGSFGMHPVLACAGVVEAALQDVAGARLEGQLAGWRMRVMAAAGEVAEESADRSVATWLAARDPHRGP